MTLELRYSIFMMCEYRGKSRHERETQQPQQPQQQPQQPQQQPQQQQQQKLQLQQQHGAGFHLLLLNEARINDGRTHH